MKKIIPTEVYITIVNYFLDGMMNRELGEGTRVNYKYASYYLKQCFEYQDDAKLLQYYAKFLAAIEGASSHIKFVYEENFKKQVTPEMDYFYSLMNK